MFASKDIFLKSSGGYQISRSVRLRSSASAYLSRTPATTTNRKTFTYSLWVKRGILSSSGTYELMNCGTKTVSQVISQFNITGDKLSFETSTYGVTNYIVGTTAAVFRDPSAWYHIVFAIDTTQATNSNGVKIYVNGVQQTLTFSAYTQNYDTAINTNNLHDIGQNRIGSDYFDGYLTEINFIDGQALTPSSFGETNPITGVWQPKAYSGTYGTNGFYLNFSDNSGVTATTIGKDYSGNGNNWTPNNISITAGVTYDSMTDVPTLTSATAANFCTLNPLATSITNKPAVSDGNLKQVGNGGSMQGGVLATTGITSGKYYWETTVTALQTTNGYVFVGVAPNNYTIPTAVDPATTLPGKSPYYGVCVFPRGAGSTELWANSVSAMTDIYSGFGQTSSGDVIQVAFDADSGKIWFGRNNTWYNSGVPSSGTTPTATLTISGYTPFIPCNGTYGSADGLAVNFGQRPFTYTPPTGFVALNTQNLPTPTISNGATVMAATTYTGTGSAMSVSNAVNNVSFQPDWVWIKQRNNAANHVLADAIRGVDKYVFSNLTNAEATATAGTGITAFNSNGFSLGTETSTVGSVNAAGGTGTYVAWQWNAGGSTVTNTNGSISAQVRANTTAGFSVVTWTNPASGTPTIGHGLGVAPTFIIVKDRTFAYNWDVGCTSIGWANRLNLNATSAAYSPAFWNSTAPTSTVFTYAASGGNSGDSMVAYCFAAVAGYSAFGSYTGNGSTDGPFVFLGFRPRFVLVKRTDVAATWYIWNTSSNTFNVIDTALFPNLTNAESSNVAYYCDILSNGFKPRATNTDVNANGGTYIYMAFSEVGFKYALGR